VNTQRKEKKAMDRNQKSSMTRERLELLENIGWSNHGEGRGMDAIERWHQRLDELNDYKLKYGNCNVSSRYQPNPQLGFWVIRQRAAKKQWIGMREAA
jgi:hypothetical protein